MNRSYESNGGDVKIRGTALHVAEKYVQLARDAQSAGDRVAAENYLQHAEHYYRILAAAQAQMPQPQPIIRSDDVVDDDEREMNENGSGGDHQPFYQGVQPSFPSSEPQPYMNGNDQEQAGGEAPVGAEAQGGGGRERGGHFRRRRPFRERYGDRGADRGNDRGDRGERNDQGGRPDNGGSQVDD
jgi:hypothetical protein